MGPEGQLRASQVTLLLCSGDCPAVDLQATVYLYD